MMIDNPEQRSMQPKRFEINIPDATLADMQQRLRSTRWAEDFGNRDWGYGVERGWLEDMVSYWAEAFDWRAQEAELNRLPHYRVTIDGIPIHFVHLKGRGPNPRPLILTHGWPWTFHDWQEVAYRLADPEAFGGRADDAFDVVVPSLPGFAFSSPLATTGVDPQRIATLWLRLMCDVLGYQRFGAAGGDWGAMVTGEMALAHADHLAGIYLTLPVLPGLDGRYFTPDLFAPDEAWMPARRDEAASTLVSHISVHAYDPQTLAYALADSPVGTAAWLWERRRAWSDCNGDLVAHYGRDFLCTNASLYWLTNTIGSSLRIYKECFNPATPPAPRTFGRIEVPTAMGISPRELAFMPRQLAEERCNLQHWTLFPRGGHFAPAENPQGIADDMRAFFRRWH
jgi:pimeloyl-ACP methyl ester carboxylesterase